MPKNLIKYIAFYGKDNEEKREYSLSAVNKINYICESLIENEKRVNIISPSWTTKNNGVYRGNEENIEERITLKIFFTFGAKKKISKGFKYLTSLTQLFVYLLLNTKKGETIIVYHSLMLYYPILIIKKIKKIKIILEVEEIYQDVQILSKKMKKIENKIFQLADKYLFSTELLNKKINKNKCPFLVIYGTYHLEKINKNKFNDDKIHIVYAGTLDLKKEGAITAALTARYLPNNYHIHILGFGTDEDKKKILEIIKENCNKKNATVTYDGILKGEDYINFLQKCDIGLSTQNPELEFNDTSYPSKILSYMSNGLRVITARILVVEKSKIGNYMYYYNKQDPALIAKKILEIDLNDNYCSRKIITDLDANFKREIKYFLREE